MTDESMQIGTSVSPCTSGIACAISPTSSASGSPTLTSSMFAPPSTCCATSSSSCERSPACNWAWNALRPVGLIRSPITQKGCSGPMTTVLDRDWTTVSTQLPFGSSRDFQPFAQPGDPRFAAEADQVDAGGPGQRARPVGELAGDLEAFVLGIGSALTALDQLRRNRDPRNVLVDVAQRPRRAHEADRRQQRNLVGEPRRDGFLHERRQPVRLEADLELEEARSCAHLLERACDPVVVRRRVGILDRAEEEMRRGIELPPGEIRALRQRRAEREQL